MGVRVPLGSFFCLELAAALRARRWDVSQRGSHLFWKRGDGGHEKHKKARKQPNSSPALSRP